MDALMAAFVAGILIQASDRVPWLAAILGDRSKQPGVVIIGAAIALAAVYALGAIGGALIARLTPEAHDLFLGLALIFAGSTAFSKIKPPERLEGWRVGTFLTATLGLFILAFGDRLQFVTAALAARGDGPIPALAAIGAWAGSLVVVVPATLAGEAVRARWPLTPIRWISGALLMLAGVWLALGALRLI